MKSTQHGFGILEFMIALSLGVLIMLTLFGLFTSMKNVYQRQIMFSDIQDRLRFISLFLGEKIRMTGNFSCQSEKPAPSTEMIRQFSSEAAKESLGLTIKSGTDVLQLRECVRLHDHEQFLPIDFFVANTYRVNSDNKIIYALFMKINDHPREELIPGMANFQVHLSDDKRSVTLDYVLSHVPNISTVHFLINYGRAA